jgi:hypothetical protein
MTYLMRTYNAPAGNNYLVDPDFLYSRILKVKVDGVGYDIVFNVSPGNRQVQYIPGFGFQWQNNFNGTEKIYILGGH